MRAPLTLPVLLPWLLVACGGGSSSAPDAGSPDAGIDAASIVDLRIFHTNDEHGWLAPLVDGGQVLGGAANVYAHWLEDGYDPLHDLALSGGDNFTGPAISTWFEGEPAIDAMNVMGYRASAIGNHEFDFGRDVLAARGAQADFGYLAANVRMAGSGLPVDFAEPYLIVDVDGVKVGIVGLATVDTPTLTLSTNIADLEFLDAAATLDQVVPEVRALGAEVVVVLAHACLTELTEAHALTTATVDAWMGGHCHGPFDGGMEPPIFATGWAWRSYSVLTLSFDRQTRTVVGATRVTTPVSYPEAGPNPVVPEPELAALVERWQGLADDALGEPLGHTTTGLRTTDGWIMGNWLTDAWMRRFPDADVALTNWSSMRANLASGTITRAGLVDMLPFESVIYELRLTGAELTDELARIVDGCGGTGGTCHPAVGGMRYSTASGTLALRLEDGTPIDPATTYRVLVTDFQYGGGAGYQLASKDPAPYDTGVSYREPLEEHLVELATTDLDPLEAHLDPAPRDE